MPGTQGPDPRAHAPGPPALGQEGQPMGCMILGDGRDGATSIGPGLHLLAPGPSDTTHDAVGGAQLQPTCQQSHGPWEVLKPILATIPSGSG